MSVATLILGESGTGKTTSLRNLDPQKTILIQSVSKLLPFKADAWQGSAFTAKNYQEALYWLDVAKKREQRKIVVIDDFQYFLAIPFMRRRQEGGWQKWTDFAGIGFDLFDKALNLRDDQRVYILGHTQTNDYGQTKIKTLGKMLDEKLILEGLVTITLRTVVQDGKYMFSTKNNGFDTVKSPIGLFSDTLIENDLKAIDDRICEFYRIS